MTDIRKICKIFLEFVYDNQILPQEIVNILKNTDNGDNEWDFRLICKLLRYKEKYLSGYASKNSIEEKLNQNIRCLQDVDIWRDNMSGIHLDLLWKTANSFFHNVTTSNPMFEAAIHALIKSADKPNSAEFMAKLNNLTMPCPSTDNTIPSVPTYIGTYAGFIKIIKDYVKNQVPVLTRAYKKGGCRWCNSKDKTLHAAHLRGREIEVLIKEVWDSLAQPTNKSNIFNIDITAFTNKINQLHSDQNNFYFLCSECHHEYDKKDSTMPDRFDFKVKSEEISITTPPQGENIGDITRTQARDYCIINGYNVGSHYTFASPNKTKRGIYWANPKPEILKHDWDIILNDKDNKCLHVLHVPANTFDVKQFYLKINKTGERFLQLEIDQGSFIETKRNINFKPYLVKTIKY